MTKSYDGGTVTCSWRDMILTFSRMPSGMIVATGGKLKTRFIGYGMDDAIARYRKEQLCPSDQLRACTREAWLAR